MGIDWHRGLVKHALIVCVVAVLTSLLLLYYGAVVGGLCGTYSPSCINYVCKYTYIYIFHLQLCTAPAVTIVDRHTGGTNESSSSLLYLLIGAAVAMVLIIVAIVFLLGVIAWKR